MPPDARNANTPFQKLRRRWQLIALRPASEMISHEMRWAGLPPDKCTLQEPRLLHAMGKLAAPAGAEAAVATPGPLVRDVSALLQRPGELRR